MSHGSRKEWTDYTVEDDIVLPPGGSMWIDQSAEDGSIDRYTVVYGEEGFEEGVFGFGSKCDLDSQRVFRALPPRVRGACRWAQATGHLPPRGEE